VIARKKSSSTSTGLLKHYVFYTENAKKTQRHSENLFYFSLRFSAYGNAEKIIAPNAGLRESTMSGLILATGIA
jgi:hypothetical protein